MPLSKIATSLGAASAAVKMAAKWAQITFAKVAVMLAGREEIVDAMLVMVEERRVTTLFVTRVMLVGEMTAATLVRIDAHAHANVQGLGMGPDVLC